MKLHMEFEKSYLEKLCNSHLKILTSRVDHFVATKALNASLRFVGSAITKGKSRALCQPHITTILS